MATETAMAAPDLERTEVVEVNKKVLEDLIEATQSKSRELQQLALVPKTFEEAERYAKYISKSQTCPRTKDGPWSEADIFIAIQTGLELGIPPMMALSGIAIINGRATIWGDLALALVLRSGLVEDWYERPMKEALAKGEGYFKIKRKGRSEWTEVFFSVDDAKRANLWGKQGPWTNYPGRMLQMRPRSFGLRDLFPDVLKGIGISEEVRDFSTEAPTASAALEETLTAPKRKSETVPLVVVEGDKREGSTAAATPNTTTTTTTPGTPATHETPAKGTWEGVLSKIEPVEFAKKHPKTKALTGEKGTWFKLTGIDGKSFATFSTSHADVASTAVSTKSAVRIEWEKSNGKDNLKVNSIEPIIASQTTEEELPFEPGSQG